MRLHFIWLVLFAWSPLTAQVVLFDGALGTAPSDQGWPFFADPVGGHTVTETAMSGFTVFDSTVPISDRGGYFSRDPVLGIFTHPNMPMTDRSVGYTVRFDLRVVDENHVPASAGGDDNGDGWEDRAGFSLITISQDLEGLELSFWEDRIWVQEDDSPSAGDLFTQAEGVGFDATAALLAYELRVLGDRYQLVPGGGVAPLLGGELRNYTNFSGSIDPYDDPSFLFLGDNTTRGESEFELAYIAIQTVPLATTQADALVAAIAAGTQPAFFDLTGDSQVDAADLTAWLAVAGEFYLGAGEVFREGDANLDGNVDEQDLAIWSQHKFTATAAWSAGDFNADGFVDGRDLLRWNANKSATSLVAVPEPVGLLGWLAGWFVVAVRATKDRARARYKQVA